MADRALNSCAEGPLRLLSTNHEQPWRTFAGPLDYLRLAQALSLASTKAQVWSIASGFLSERLGRCSIIHRNLGDLPDAARQALANDEAGDGLLWTNQIDGRFQMVLPLRYRNKQDGWLEIEFHDLDELPPGADELIQFVVYTAAGDCARVDNSWILENHVRDLSFINRIEVLISESPNVASIGSMVQEELCSVVENTFFALLTTHNDPTVLEVVAYKRQGDIGSLGYLVPIEGSRAGSVFTSGKPLLINNVLEDEGAYGRDNAEWRSLVIVPLATGGEAFGVMMVGHELAGFYTERDLQIIELTANHIANAIYRLLGDERDCNLYRAAIEALSAAVDARDPYTHTHSMRVAELARRVALHLGFSERDAEEIELAGLLHDIGKIGVPDRVLAKPGPLDSEERLVIMSHAELGANIVGRSPLLASLTPMVRHHHEWFDGRGYPDGLRGDEIPLSAAILSVADALETMTTNRIYRSALTLEQAKQELRNGRGSQFHPDAAAALLELLDSDPEVQRLLEDAPDERQMTSTLLPMNSSHVADLRVMQRIASEIGTLTELDTFLEHVHVIVRDELDLADLVIWLYSDEERAFELFAGETDLPAPAKLVPSSVSIRGTLMNSDSVGILSRGEDNGEPDKTVIFPMYVEDSLIGLIELVLFEPGEVAGRDVDLLHAIAAPVASTVRVAQLHDAAKRAAMTDGLTGVLNHRAFYQSLDRIVSDLGSGEAVHLLIVDVIGLKAINDNYGHLTGDKVLKAVADALVRRLRAGDIVARYGGDEFAAILRGSLDTSIDEIVASIEAPVPCEVEDGFTLNVRLRCGAAHSVDRDTRATELVARADELLYQRVRPSARVATGD